MSLYVLPPGFQGFRTDNFGISQTAQIGTSVAVGTSDVEGAWVQTNTALASEATGILVRIGVGATIAVDKSQLLDIGWDVAGGTSYVAKISNIPCGQTHTSAGQTGLSWFFPIRIPAGSTVAVRVQGTYATANTVRASCKVYGQPRHPWQLPVGQYAETIGTITGSQGVGFTPGNDVMGTWVSLGTTSARLWWWQLGVQISNAVMAGVIGYYVELGYGTTGNQRVFLRKYLCTGANETISEAISEDLIGHEAYCPLPGSTEIWVRGQGDGAPETGWNAVAIGIG